MNRDVKKSELKKAISYNPSGPFADIMAREILRQGQYKYPHPQNLHDLRFARIRAADKMKDNGMVYTMKLSSLKRRAPGFTKIFNSATSLPEYPDFQNLFENPPDPNRIRKQIYSPNFHIYPQGSKSYSHEAPILGHQVTASRVVRIPDGSFEIIHSAPQDLSGIKQHLTRLWDKSMRDDEKGQEAMSAYEWWLVHANPFGRGAAAIADGMSHIRQLHLGLPIRGEYERFDLKALALPKDAYVDWRTKRELKRMRQR